jgi:hypothetical protein
LAFRFYERPKRKIFIHKYEYLSCKSGVVFGNWKSTLKGKVAGGGIKSIRIRNN